MLNRVLVSVENESDQVPSQFFLNQNFPNPFNPSTKIKYEVPGNGNISLKVYDVLGKEITVIVNEIQNTGIYEVNFNGNNLPGGVYFYKLEAFDPSIKKMILIK